MKYVPIPLFFALLGCYQLPDTTEMKTQFLANRDTFEQLRAMIKEDIKERECFAVGFDHLGEFWEFDGLWNTNQNYERKVKLNVVLEEEHLTKDRYEKYLELLEATGAQRIEFCSELNGGWTRMIMETSGISVSGTSSSIEVYEDQSIPTSDIQKSYSSEVSPIVDGWHIKHDSN